MTKLFGVHTIATVTFQTGVAFPHGLSTFLNRVYKCNNLYFPTTENRDCKFQPCERKYYKDIKNFLRVFEDVDQVKNRFPGRCD